MYEYYILKCINNKCFPAGFKCVVAIETSDDVRYLPILLVKYLVIEGIIIVFYDLDYIKYLRYNY